MLILTATRDAVNDIEYGRCVSLTKQAARNEAARQALRHLGWNV